MENGNLFGNAALLVSCPGVSANPQLATSFQPDEIGMPAIRASLS